MKKLGKAKYVVKVNGMSYSCQTKAEAEKFANYYRAKNRKLKTTMYDVSIHKI